MKDIQLSRRQVLKGAGAIGVLGAIGIPTTIFAGDEEVELLRWDLINGDFPQGFVLAGGQDVATDQETHDVLTLTGSGEASPKNRTATGGGTFVHTHMNGTEVAHGVYRVKGFQSFKAAGGTLSGVPGLTDGIGTFAQTIGGVLTLGVELTRSDGASVAGVLGVDCDLGGEFPVTEGVTLDVLSFKFRQSAGATLFHVLRGVNQTN